MGIFSNQATPYYKKAENAINTGVQNQQNALAPYTQNAGTDFNNLRDAFYKGANNFANTPNAGASFTDYLKMSPNQLVEQAMQGFKESPYQTANRKAQAEAENHRLQSEGLYGSGQGNLEQGEIQQKLDEQYQNDYLSNAMKAFGVQGQVYDRYASARSQIAKMLGIEESQLFNKEGNATNLLSSILGKQGTDLSNLNQKEGANASEARQNLFHQLAGLTGLAVGGAVGGPAGIATAMGINSSTKGRATSNAPQDNNQPIGYGSGGTPLNTNWIDSLYGG